MARERLLVPPDSGSDASSQRAETELHPDEEQGVELAASDLSPDALRGLVEEFVSREGTDYGHVDRSLESKVRDVMRQLREIELKRAQGS